MKDWIFIGVIVIFFVAVIINGAIDFLSKIPNTPLGVFLAIVAAIPAWIIAKTIFMRPPDEEIKRDWNFYAAFVVITIFVLVAGAILLAVKFALS